MISLANPHPISTVLYKRNNIFSPKLYLKESYLRRKERTITNAIITATGAASGALMVIAGFTLLNALHIL